MVGKLNLGIILLVVLLCHGSAAQTKEEEKHAEAKKTTRLTLSSASAEPGQPVLVTIYVTPAEGIAVGGVKLEITYGSANLKFERLEPGITAEIAEVDLTSDIKTGKNDEGVETSTLTIKTKASNSEPLSQGILGGLFAYVTFKISESAGPAVIPLHTVAEVVELGSNKPLANLQTADASVEVFAPGTQPPAVSCFFFTH